VWDHQSIRPNSYRLRSFSHPIGVEVKVKRIAEQPESDRCKLPKHPWCNCAELGSLRILLVVSLSYEKFELRVMLSLCFSHMANVASPFRFSVFHILAKLCKICEKFFQCEKKTMKLSLLHKNVNTSSHRKDNLMALTTVYQFELWLKVWDKPSKLSLPRQGPWKLVWVKQAFELSEVELTEFHCT